MTYEERLRFIDREIKGLWPQWEPTDAELRVWMSCLEPLDYGAARAAAQACFAEQTVNYHRPVLGKFLDRVRALSRRAAGPAPTPQGPTTEVFLECLEAPPDRPHLVGVHKAVSVPAAAQDRDPDHLRASVEPLRVRFEQLYGGHWIVVVAAAHSDDGLCGPDARDRAYDLILAGSDTPGRRYLQTRREVPNA